MTEAEENYIRGVLDGLLNKIKDLEFRIEKLEYEVENLRSYVNA